MPKVVNKTTYYSTSEACKIAGTYRATFLRWVREGKVEDVAKRDRNGWRLFSEADIKRLRTSSNLVLECKR
jgi:predicted site-specific integrase-resolvase